MRCAKQNIYSTLVKEICAAKNKIIDTKTLFAVAESISCDMPAFLQSPEGKKAFIYAINDIVEEQAMSPVGKKTDYDGLHYKYKINKEANVEDNRLLSEIIRSIPLPASIDYYSKHQDIYLIDRDAIKAIVGFLKEKDDNIVTTNERAYELFGDEKFFKGDGKTRSRGETILKRLGLNYSQLGCYETVEPFFSFCRKDFYVKQSRSIFIIENKDTFWTFKKFFMDKCVDFKLDMLIFGEGKKILSSFKFIEEYVINHFEDSFFYFGDLDSEGVNIYCDLRRKFPDYNIKPFIPGYKSILEIGSKKDPKRTPKAQSVCIDNIEEFAGEFDKSIEVKIKELLIGGFYIPQEALSAKRIKERSAYFYNA